MRVLGVDASLRATGLAVLDIDGPRAKVVHAVCILTEPDKGKDLIAAERTARDIDEILRRTIAVVDRFAPSLVVMEAPAGSQNAVAAAGLAAAHFGIRCGLLMRHGLPIRIVTAYAAKKHVAGTADAEKSAVISAVEALVGPLSELVTREVNQRSVTVKVKEAVADAIAVAMVGAERRSS